MVKEPTSAPTKIAVLGGGAGSLAAVFGITSQPGWQERYDITVYQMGWRLGGKGASGRDCRQADRIYEHGFHMWMGFYANAFVMMRECYDERARLLEDPGAFRTWTDAFAPRTRFVFSEHIGDSWHPWVIDYPAFPGDPSRPDETLRVWDYLRVALDLLRQHLARVAPLADSAPPDRATHPLLERLAARISRDLEDLAVGGAVAALEAVAQLVEALAAVHVRTAPVDAELDLLAAGFEHLRSRVWSRIAAAIEGNDEARRLWIVLDLGCTVLKGLFADRVVARGFDAIDDVEFRAWLRRHGASDLAIESTPVAALYAANFSFIGGRLDRPDFAAGVALQSYLRIFLASRGPFSWVMQSGMGDVVFAPLYQVLQARGVKFAFFHRVTALWFDAGENAVTAIEMENQVALKRPYEPLYRVKGVDAWPSTPFCDHIEHGDELERAIVDGTIDLESVWSPPWRDATSVTLARGRDFDVVVLGISLGALGGLCTEISGAKPAWQQMLEQVVTVPTQSQQIWLTRDLEDLGWPSGPACVEGYPSPLGQWLDATHALAYENWPANARPAGLVYFCDVFADVPNEDAAPDYPARRLDVARRGMREWLERYTGAIWPSAVFPGTAALDWRFLVDLSERTGEARLGAQFCRVNVEPSERFVLSVTGSTDYRLTAGGSGVDNLYLTGDWVRNGFNVGCVESTVMSGLQCSRAITGYPATIAHEHFFRFGSDQAMS